MASIDKIKLVDEILNQLEDEKLRAKIKALINKWKPTWLVKIGSLPYPFNKRELYANEFVHDLAHATKHWYKVQLTSELPTKIKNGILKLTRILFDMDKTWIPKWWPV